MWRLSIDPSQLIEIVTIVSKMFVESYPELSNVEQIQSVLSDEVKQYKTVAESTKKYIAKNYTSGQTIENPFDIYQSVGASKDLIAELSLGLDVKVDFSDFDEKLKEHQEKSKSNMGQRFKGGLGEHSEETTKYHTATHLLHRALREVLGDGVHQMGSNITPERLRFDFSYGEKMTEDQIKEVSAIINKKIQESLPVNKVQLSKEEAGKTGALHFFKDKYGDQVTVYYIGDSLETAWSKEFCGGPHVSNTSEIGSLKIVKEEAVGKGVRRIKAIF
jgi:alanyl-tRNA synthetase